MTLKSFGLIFILGFFVSCGSTPAPKIQMSSTEASSQVAVYHEIQRYRVAQGRKPLDLSLALTTLAQEIAQERASAELDPQYKLGPRGGTSARVVQARRNLAVDYISEAIYAGNQGAPEVIATLARSPGTRATMDGQWNQIGVGVATSASGTRHYVVITALKVRHRNINMPEAF